MNELKNLANKIREEHKMDGPPGGMGFVIDTVLNNLASLIDKIVPELAPDETSVDIPEGYAEVEHFKESGKYNVTDHWRIPENCIDPRDMKHSPDYRDIGCTIVVPSQEPWGYPAVLKTVPMPDYPEYKRV